MTNISQKSVKIGGVRAAQYINFEGSGKVAIVEPPADLSSVGGLINWATQAGSELKNRGCMKAMLAIDCDGYLQTLISPKQGNKPPGQPIKLMGEIFAGLKLHIEELGVGICVEELCPGGLDLTFGIEISKKLCGLGAAYVVASCGSEAFPPLKARKRTALGKIQDRHNESLNWLAGPRYLLQELQVPVFVQGPFQGNESEIEKVMSLGFSGLIKEP